MRDASRSGRRNCSTSRARSPRDATTAAEGPNPAYRSGDARIRRANADPTPGPLHRADLGERTFGARPLPGAPHADRFGGLGLFARGCAAATFRGRARRVADLVPTGPG